MAASVGATGRSRQTRPQRRSLPRVESAVLIPVKSFDSAKARLAPFLSPSERCRVARWTATRVVQAARGCATYVACDDSDVAEWAGTLGAEVLWGAGMGLNGAVDHGVRQLAEHGFSHVTITHSDLPFPSAVPRVSVSGRVVIVPDQRRDGTNVMSRPTGAELPARYGANSFRRHVADALNAGLPVTIRTDARLSIDIDTIDDCHHRLVRPLLEKLLERPL